MKITLSANGQASLLLLAVPVLCALTSISTAQTQSAATTVILVRHAEKHATPATDPSLTSEGETRARSLARILAQAGVKAVLTSQYLRTRETARPTADAAAVTAVVVPLEPDPADRRKISQQSINALVAGIHRYSGETVLVVGHSNTVPLVIAALGGGQVPEIPETEFDNMFVLTLLDKGKAKVTHLKY